jgi:hypothetical protein
MILVFLSSPEPPETLCSDIDLNNMLAAILTPRILRIGPRGPSLDGRCTFPRLPHPSLVACVDPPPVAPPLAVPLLRCPRSPSTGGWWDFPWLLHPFLSGPEMVADDAGVFFNLQIPSH